MNESVDRWSGWTGMKEYVKGWIGGWMNRWTEAHAMVGSGLRQEGARNSFPYFHLKLMFSLCLFLLSTRKD